MNRQHVIADTHFGHDGIIEWEHQFRPFKTIEEHDRTLVEMWNSRVKPKDTVWHLGDVFFGGKDNHGILGSLNGIKKLILGNHDVYPMEVYLQYFRKVFSSVAIKGCLLTHVPIHPQQLEKRFRGNIHGHMHSLTIPDGRYLCVSAEQTGLGPILLSDAIGRIEQC